VQVSGKTSSAGLPAHFCDIGSVEGKTLGAKCLKEVLSFRSASSPFELESILVEHAIVAEAAMDPTPDPSALPYRRHLCRLLPDRTNRVSSPYQFFSIQRR
jgi:hypothetical protein